MHCSIALCFSVLAQLWSELSTLELDESQQFLAVPDLAELVMMQPPDKLFVRESYVKFAEFIRPGTGIAGTERSVD